MVVIEKEHNFIDQRYMLDVLVSVRTQYLKFALKQSKKKKKREKVTYKFGKVLIVETGWTYEGS